MDTATAIILLVAIIALIAGLSAIEEAAKYRRGAKVSTAIILGIFLTPVTGFLYLLCFPEKKEEIKKD